MTSAHELLAQPVTIHLHATWQTVQPKLFAKQSKLDSHTLEHWHCEH